MQVAEVLHHTHALPLLIAKNIHIDALAVHAYQALIKVFRRVFAEVHAASAPPPMLVVARLARNTHGLIEAVFVRPVRIKVLHRAIATGVQGV